MNCRGCRQRFLPLPDLSRKIEGDSVCKVPSFMTTDQNNPFQMPLRQIMQIMG